MDQADTENVQREKSESVVEKKKGTMERVDSLGVGQADS